MTTSLISTSVIDARHIHKLRHVTMLQPTLVRVIQGNKAVFNGTDQFTLTPKELLFWPTRHPLEITNQPDQGRYCAQLIHFDPQFLTDFAQRQKNTRTSSTSAPQALKYGGLMPLDALTQEAWDNLFDKVEQQRPAVLVEHYAQEILLCLSVTGIDIAQLWQAQTDSLSQQVQKLLHDDLERDWSVEQVAKTLHLGTSTLRRKLALEGKSFRQILEDVRLTQAMAYLQTSPQAIGVISFRCGYASASRFSLRFRERFGITPRHLRMAIKSNKKIDGNNYVVN